MVLTLCGAPNFPATHLARVEFVFVDRPVLSTWGGG